MIYVRIQYTDFLAAEPLYKWATYNNMHIQHRDFGKTVLWVKQQDYTEAFKELLLESSLKGVNIEIIK
jgi:hypothetical protein